MAIAELMSEDDLEAAFLDLVTFGQWRAVHHPDSRRMKGHRGLPDWILIRPPRLLFVELKKQNGIVRPDQAIWLGMLQRVPGVEAYVWRPKHLNDGTIARTLR